MADGTTVGPIGRIRGSFSLKLLLLFGIVVVLIGGIGGFIYVQTADALEEDTQDRMEKTTQLQAETLAGWVDGAENQAGLLASEDAVQSDDVDRIDETLASYGDRAPPGVTAIHYVDSEGVVRSSTREDAVGTNYEAEWVDALPATDATHSDPYTDPTIEGDAVAVYAGDGNGGSVVFVADLQALSETLERPSSNDASFTHVVDDEGTVVLSHDAGQIGGQNMGGEGSGVMSDGVRRGLQGDTGYVEMNMGGTDMSMGYTRVEGTDWVIMTHVPSDDAFALQEDISQSLIALIAVALLGLGAIGVVVGRNTTKSIRDLAASAEEIEDGNLDAELETGRIDEIGQLYRSFDSMRDSLRESLEETAAARDRAEERQEELAELAEDLERTADELAIVAEAAADGDLTQEMSEHADNESMARIAEEFNEMTDDISDTVGELRTFADTVAAHGQQVTASAEEVESASAQVSNSVQSIADRTESQHEKYDAVRARMEDMTATTEEIASQSDQVAELAERTAETGEAGKEAAREAAQAITSIDEDAEQAVEEFDQLRDQLERVEEIAESIGEIAGQTNMLALNANIEASRTNDGGGEEAGFGAVAEEVKDMAADTQESANEIEQIVEEIRTQTETTAAEVESTREEVAANVETIEEATEALDEIADYAEQTYDGVEEITTASQTQAASAEEVLAMVEDAAELSEAVHEEAGRVAAAAEEQTSALSTVTDEASSLTQDARRLREHLESFEIDASESASGGVPAAGE